MEHVTKCERCASGALKRRDGHSGFVHRHVSSRTDRMRPSPQHHLFAALRPPSVRVDVSARFRIGPRLQRTVMDRGDASVGFRPDAQEYRGHRS